MAGMRYLVTGGTGFIGRRVVAKLLESHSDDVGVLVRRSSLARFERLAADWGERAKQGKEVLYKHALQGFTGKKGMMPPKGGSAALPDTDVKAAVDYMASK